MLRTHINCAICNAPIGDLETPDGVGIYAVILKCNKCRTGVGGYAEDGMLNPKMFQKPSKVMLHEGQHPQPLKPKIKQIRKK